MRIDNVPLIRNIASNVGRVSVEWSQWFTDLRIELTRHYAQDTLPELNRPGSWAIWEDTENNKVYIIVVTMDKTIKKVEVS